MEIKKYEDKYRDDMIFMVLQAKDALGRVPGLNDDLLDIKTHYLDRGDMFWVVVNQQDRVIGCGGYSRITSSSEAYIHRLYVKATEKRQGIGAQLLHTIETEIRRQGIKVARVHLGTPPEQWFESYAFYPKQGYVVDQPGYMKKEL